MVASSVSNRTSTFSTSPPSTTVTGGPGGTVIPAAIDSATRCRRVGAGESLSDVSPPLPDDPDTRSACTNNHRVGGVSLQSGGGGGAGSTTQKQHAWTCIAIPV